MVVMALWRRMQQRFDSSDELRRTCACSVAALTPSFPSRSTLRNPSASRSTSVGKGRSASSCRAVSCVCDCLPSAHNDDDGIQSRLGFASELLRNMFCQAR